MQRVNPLQPTLDFAYPLVSQTLNLPSQIMTPEEAGLLYQWVGPAMPEGVGAINATEDNPGVRVVIHE